MIKTVLFLPAVLLGIAFAGCVQQETHAQKMQSVQLAAAERLGVPVKFKNSLGMELAFIPAGEFMMGSRAESRDANFSEMPRHRVRITRPFYIGTCEVTQEQYKKLMEKLPSYDSQAKSSVGPRFPAEFISQGEAMKFCRLLSKKEGRKYRLPTEAEWEYACRAGTGSPFYFGETISADQANYDGNTPYGNGKIGIYRGGSTPVGSFPPNAFGLYDMHGNVWEWCSDLYSDSYYIRSPQLDPKGPETGSLGGVLRGGSWNDGPWYCRSTTRNRFYSYNCFKYHFGFRVVCELSPEDNEQKVTDKK